MDITPRCNYWMGVSVRISREFFTMIVKSCAVDILDVYTQISIRRLIYIQKKMWHVVLMKSYHGLSNILEYYPLCRVRLSNNGRCFMYLYILIKFLMDQAFGSRLYRCFMHVCQENECVMSDHPTKTITNSHARNAIVYIWEQLKCFVHIISKIAPKHYIMMFVMRL